MQPGPIEGSAHSRQTEPGIGHALPGEYVSRRIEILQKAYLKLLLPNIFSLRNRTRWLRNGQGLPVCLSLGHSALSCHQMVQMISSTGGSTGETSCGSPIWFSCHWQLPGRFCWAKTSSRKRWVTCGIPNPGCRVDICGPSTRTFAFHCEGGQHYSGGQSAIYKMPLSHKDQSVFSNWCAVWNEDSSSCVVATILSFLQKLLDKGYTPFMLKVYVPAIATNLALVAGQFLGRNVRGELGDLTCLAPILFLLGTCLRSSGTFKAILLNHSKWLTYGPCHLRLPCCKL